MLPSRPQKERALAVYVKSFAEQRVKEKRRDHGRR
jgi:hypothetical protein